MRLQDLVCRELSIAGHTMLVRDLSFEDMPAVLALHQRVFGGVVDLPWYDWKYKLGGGEAVGVWTGGELIAHCAGLPRSFWFNKVPVSCLQIGDVMVAPEWRGILTRHGPFFYASQSLYGSRLGFDGRFALGFGFPNARHMRLAERSGLSWDCAAMHELEWGVGDPPAALDCLWRVAEISPEDEGFKSSVDLAWLAMKAGASSLHVGDRSDDHVRWRYASRPGPQHHFFKVSRPWSRHALGVLVLGPVVPGQPVHWLDWIGPVGAVAQVSRLCRQVAGRLGASSVLTWASPAVVAALGSSEFIRQTEVARIGVPVASGVSPEAVGDLAWWFMSGDTDFL